MSFATFPFAFSCFTASQLGLLADTIAHRVCRHLAHEGWLKGEDESAFLSDRAGCDDGLDALRMSSITYRIATGKHAGRKVATLQTIPADAHKSQKLERLYRYIARPAISENRLSLSPQGKVRYQLKTPWKNGTTQVQKQFVLYRDSRDEWRWTLFASNGKRIADSAEGYVNRTDAINGARLVAAVATNAPVWEPSSESWV